MDKKMKLFQLVIISAFVATLIIPVANAEIKINNVFIPDVVVSSSPNYGSFRFSIVVEKPAGQDESFTVPVIINGTSISTIYVSMKANEVSKIVPVNVTLPGASILMINPFANPKPIPNDVIYAKASNPYTNPISSIQYEVKIGDFKKNISLLVYADWSFWAIIIDIVLMAATFFVIKRFITT